MKAEKLFPVAPVLLIALSGWMAYVGSFMIAALYAFLGSFTFMVVVGVWAQKRKEKRQSDILRISRELAKLKERDQLRAEGVDGGVHFKNIRNA